MDCTFTKPLFTAVVMLPTAVKHTMVLNARTVFFLKKWANPGLFFVYFRPFLITISIIQIEKSIDGVLMIQTRGRRMVGADETTELWRPLKRDIVLFAPTCSTMAFILWLAPQLWPMSCLFFFRCLWL